MDEPETNSQKSPRPDFLIVGAAKTGTTSIYDYLKQHPEIYLPTKETFFFISEKFKDNKLPYPMQRPHEEIVFDADRYLNLYRGSNGQKAMGEVATGYLEYYKSAIPKIKKHLGDEVRIIAVLRNPVERAYSGYTFFSRDLHEKLSFEDALAAEAQRTADNWDFMWHYVEHGKYAAGVKAYLESFPNVRIMLFDDLKNDPQAFMKDLFAFIGVNPRQQIDMGMKNVSGAPKSRAFQTLVTQENPVKRVFRPLLRTFFSRETRHKMRSWLKARNVGEKQRLTADQYNALLPQFEDDISELEHLLNRRMPDWRTTRVD